MKVNPAHTIDQDLIVVSSLRCLWEKNIPNRLPTSHKNSDSVRGRGYLVYECVVNSLASACCHEAQRKGIKFQGTIKSHRLLGEVI